MLDETARERRDPLVAPRPFSDARDPAGATLPYTLPALPRRRRDERDDGANEARPRGSFGKKLGLVLALCVLIAGLAALLMRRNQRPNVPVQVLDTESGPVSPPPVGATDVPKKMQPPPVEEPKPEIAKSSENEAPSKGVEPSKTQQAQPAPAERPQTAPDKQASGDESTDVAVDDVELLSEPPGAKVVVDNKPDTACTSPCTLSLPNGRHTLEARLNGYDVARRIFTVPDDNSLFLTLTKNMGTLVVTSSPPGVTIFVDGKDYGHTPSTLHLPTGTHTLLLVNGALRQEETVDIQNDTLAARSFRFSKQ